MADEKSPMRISHRLLAINRSEMRSNMAKKYNRDLILNGSMLSAILSLAIPVVINSFLQTMYNLTDTYWLGHIGKEELAAINLVTPVQNIVINFGTGITVAGSVLIAQYIGARAYVLCNQHRPCNCYPGSEINNYILNRCHKINRRKLLLAYMSQPVCIRKVIHRLQKAVNYNGNCK